MAFLPISQELATVWTFLFPRQDGTIYIAVLGGRNLQDAFEGFSRYHWTPTMPAVGVWRNSCLEGRVLPVLNVDTLQMEPKLQTF